MVIPLPHVLGPKYERLQRPRNSDEFQIGESQGRPSHELRRGRQSSPFWALWMIQLPRTPQSQSHKVTPTPVARSCVCVVMSSLSLSKSLSISLSLRVQVCVSGGGDALLAGVDENSWQSRRGTRVPAVHSSHPAAACMLPVRFNSKPQSRLAYALWCRGY